MNTSRYLRNAKKFVDRNIDEITEKILARYGLSEEENITIYDLFTKKMQVSIYAKVPVIKSLGEKVESARKTFIELSIKDQCIVLLQLLKTFTCNREVSDLTLIGLSKNSGVIMINKNFAKLTSAFLIYQSPTGLTEKKVNLLK